MATQSASSIKNIGENFSRGPLLKSIDDLKQDGISEETVVRVEGARLVYVNYKILQLDFPQLSDRALEMQHPQLKKLKGTHRAKMICAKIDEWLIRNTAFISTKQAAQSIVNTPIATSYEQTIAYRPPGYGRGLVYSVEENDKNLLYENVWNEKLENRLIDVKGTGIAPDSFPQMKHHSNGINTVEYALYELVIMELLQRVFNHAKSNVKVLPIYAIIDLGFDERDDRWPSKPASLLIRRAHRRPKDSGGLYTCKSTGQLVQLDIELLLRRYGITATNTNTTIKIWRENGNLQVYYGNQHVDFLNEEQAAEIIRVSNYEDSMGVVSFEGINIQQTREIGLHPTTATLVDFQSYNVKQQFTNPLLSLVSDLLLRWGGSILPNSSEYVLPDPALQIPYDQITGTGPIWGYKYGDNKPKIESLCQGLAEDFRARYITRELLLNTLNIYLASLTSHIMND